MFISKIIEEQKRKVQREKNKEVTKNIIAGITIGSVLGILFAPQSGEETRTDIQEKSKEIGYDIKDGINKSKEDLEEFKGTLAQIKSDIKDRAKLGVGPVEENYTKIADIEIIYEEVGEENIQDH